MKVRWLLPALAAAALVFVSCGPRGPEESLTSGHAIIPTSDAIVDFAWFLSKEYQTSYPGAFVDIVRMDTRSGVDSLLSERTEQIFMDRKLTSAETLAFWQNKLKLHGYSVAYYPVFLLVPKSNPLQAIDSTGLLGIITGVVDNWKQVGGDDLPVTCYLPLPREGAWDALFSYYGRLDSITAVTCSTAKDMLGSAKGNDGALLLYSKPIDGLNYRPLRFRRGDEEIPPNVKTIIEEPTYPFRLDITYYTTKNKRDVAAGYLTFAVSNLGQRRIMDGLRYRPAAVPVRIVQLRQS